MNEPSTVPSSRKWLLRFFIAPLIWGLLATFSAWAAATADVMRVNSRWHLRPGRRGHDGGDSPGLLRSRLRGV